ncbi:MAG: cyclic pyranopterin monophosphate synthase MoaC [Dehalococcoidia bacterium]|nr:cyclic pyranopterin monophosphate synthase MoaC [Dehalococcoidia bacterium]
MIDIYTDGSCIGNPGPGGWAAIIIENGATRKLHGRDDNTTNNKMEILAVIEGIEATPSGADVRVHSDSTYVINTMTKNWKRNKNRDLWAKLDSVVAKRNVQWKWVKAHAGHPLNEQADRIANAEARGEPVNDSSSHTTPGKKLSHVDASGKAQMVDVGPKDSTERMAVVTGSVLMQPETLKLIEANDIEKGDVLGVARIAGIMAAKNTAQLIPLCHPLPLDQITVEFRLDHERSAVDIRGTARTTAKTGVEMEAMTAVSVAALTIYDMCKAVDRGMRIGDIRLRRKSGGKSGDIVLE